MQFKKHSIDLVDWNQRGLIPGPDEGEEMFFKRCANLPIYSIHSSLSTQLFDIQPNWVEIIYKNKGLRPWEGACVWIDHHRVVLQLKKSFLKKKKYLGYSRDEVIAHELVHVARSGFEEPIFEEVLAYQTASSKFRRFFGPLFRSTKETKAFIALLGVAFLVSAFSSFGMVALFGVLGIVSAGCFRLCLTQRQFLKACKRLSETVGEQKALAVMLRLTDREIVRFAKMSVSEILEYAHKMRKLHIRWEQICVAYFSTQQPL